uniref:Peregrin n=1 Tax=Globodera rostochiensis TaxID=31243 RepID=A0A914H9Z0_GLORO
MQTTTLTSNNSSLIIQYNDKTVKIEPDQPLNIKWINGKNGLKSVEPKKAKHLNLDVPVVSFRRVERLSKSGIARSFKMPTPYVCCAMEEEETNRNETEYDLDREDLTWLQMANARRHKAKRPSIDACTLECAIDMLEKESHFQFTQGEHGYDLGYLTMIDNDAPCCICNDGEDSNANQIIFCDICNIAVHQECYGVPYIPEGQWLCRRCQMSPSIPVDCALCSCTSGAFKQTSDGRWAHVVCAIWLNEVHFGNTVFLEPVEGVGFSIKRRRKLTCLICKRKVGACLQCSNKACVRSFHATCARYAGMKMVVKESRARNNADTITINRFAYCFQHSNPNRSGQTMASWKREMENNIKEARKMLDIKAKQTLKSVPVPVIPKEKVEDIAQKLGLNYVNDIYSYWSLKRKSRFGVPLIRRLQVYMNQQKPLFSGIPSDQNDGVDVGEAAVAAESSSAPPPPEEIQPGPTTTTAAVVVVDPLKCYAALRRNFERVRLLCELVKKREKMKHEQLLTNRAIVCKTMKPLAVLIDQTLAKLIEKDHQKIFAQPVTEKQVPGYFASVSRPMDFKRMCANNEKGRYKRIADLRDDFLLMIQNCTSFNKDNHWFYNYGQRIKRIGMSVIKAAELEEQRMNEVSSMVRQAID